MLALTACADDQRTFDPHVGTWQGQARGGEDPKIELHIVPGGVLTITNSSTGYSYDYSYWPRFEQEGNSWQLGIGVYPLGGQREQRFLLISQSSQDPDSLFLETDEVGKNLLGFDNAVLQRMP